MYEYDMPITSGWLNRFHSILISKSDSTRRKISKVLDEGGSCDEILNLLSIKSTTEDDPS
jgi:hypothetical protein